MIILALTSNLTRRMTNNCRHNHEAIYAFAAKSSSSVARATSLSFNTS